MMQKVLVIMPESIGGRLTASSILDGFIQNGYEADVFDELKDSGFERFLKNDYKFIAGYDFSPVKLKIDYSLKFPCIAYFSDVIEDRTSGVGYREYYKYLKNSDIFVFYWDRVLSERGGWHYQPHFVNTEIYKNISKPVLDVLFMGRLDTKLRLDTYLELNKRLSDLKFGWHAIKKHFDDAYLRCTSSFDKEILEKTYLGFIDNEKDMALAINKTKIVYNINAQGVSSLNYRTIQTLACERLLISDEREELDLFNNIIPVYHSIDELVEKIRYYLQNQDEYLKITQKAREIIEINHSCKECVNDMLLRL